MNVYVEHFRRDGANKLHQAMEYVVVISEWFDETVFAWTDLVRLATNRFFII